MQYRTNSFNQFVHRQRREILGVIEKPTDFDHNVSIDVARQISHMLSPIDVNIAVFLTVVESSK